MYTVGEVAKFLGISKDTLKFYEEKELVSPKKDDTNGYRKYSQYDINDVITVNFYRAIDMEIKQIQDIRKNKSVKDIEALLKENEEKIREEIEYKNRVLERIQSLQEDCNKIKLYLGKYSIREMKPLAIKGEITALHSYDEYETVQKNTENLKDAFTLTSLRRVIYFDDEHILRNRFIIVKKIDTISQAEEAEVITNAKCIYTIVEDGRYSNGGENIDNEVSEKIRKAAKDNGYELLGSSYVGMLLSTYEEGLDRIFLEIYTPIK